MKNLFLQQVHIFFIFFTFSTAATGQINDYEKDHYKWFDNYIGIENTGLFNGLRYKEAYRTYGEKHKFYLTSNFLNGAITYDGQTYFDIQMKYDLYEDQIIVNLISHSGNNILQLLDDKVEAFTINDHIFVKISDNQSMNSSEPLTGIFEVLYQSTDLFLYKKHKKNAKKHLTKAHVSYSFKSANQYYCYFNENYYQIKSKSDWIKVFPDRKKEIQSFYSKNKLLLHSNYDAFSVQLSAKMSHSNAINTSIN